MPNFSPFLKTSKLIVALAIISVYCTIAPAQKNAARTVKQYTIEQFMDTVRVGGSSFSAPSAVRTYK